MKRVLYSTRNGPASAITCNDRINTTFYHLFAGYKGYLIPYYSKSIKAIRKDE